VDHFAFVAHLFDGRPDFHFFLPCVAMSGDAAR
jgi:hypothetical protein